MKKIMLLGMELRIAFNKFLKNKTKETKNDFVKVLFENNTVVSGLIVQKELIVKIDSENRCFNEDCVIESNPHSLTFAHITAYECDCSTLKSKAKRERCFDKMVAMNLIVDLKFKKDEIFANCSLLRLKLQEQIITETFAKVYYEFFQQIQKFEELSRNITETSFCLSYTKFYLNANKYNQDGIMWVPLKSD